MRWFSFSALWLALAAVASADVTGSISGIVTDASGAVVTATEIAAVNTGTNGSFRARSSDGGIFTIYPPPAPDSSDSRPETFGFK